MQRKIINIAQWYWFILSINDAHRPIIPHAASYTTYIYTYLIIHGETAGMYNLQYYHI